MSKEEIVEGLYRRFLETRKRIYSSIEDVYRLLSKEPLDRATLVKILAYLRSDVKALVELIDSIGKYTDKIRTEMGYHEMFKQLPPALAVIFAILLAFSESARSLRYNFEQHASNLKYIAARIPQRYSYGDYVYSDSYIKEELYSELASILEHLRTLEVRMESELYRMGYTTIKYKPMISVLDLVTFHVSDWPGLDDRWVCAATYLAALEVCVNRVCSELGIEADSFKAKLDKLVQYMKRYGIEVSRIEKDIVSRLYDYRNKVLHGGYIPTDEELGYIIDVVPKFIQAVKGFRQKNL